MTPRRLMHLILAFVETTNLPIVPCVRGMVSLVPYGKATNDLKIIASWGKRMRFAPALPVGPATDTAVVDCGASADLEFFLERNWMSGQTISSVRQTTPRGGTHLFYRHDPAAANAVRFLGRNVDVIAREKHVMLYLENLTGDFVSRPAFPDWIAKILAEGGLA